VTVCLKVSRNNLLGSISPNEVSMITAAVIIRRRLPMITPANSKSQYSG